jgi:hypothetical protein
MSNSFSTGRVETSPVQNDSGSVSVAILDHSAGPADENPFRQQQAGLGSRTAAAARHHRVGGRHQHHPSARPLGTLNQHSFTRADGAIRRLTCHTRLSQKPWLEVLNRQHPVVGNDFSRPFTRPVLPLPGDLLVQLGDGALRCDVTLGRRFASGRLASSHCTLPTGQLCAGTLGVSQMRQVALRVSRRRDGAHTPVDADGLFADRQRGSISAHHEAGVPMPDTVAIDTNTARIRGQLPRPHNRDAQATSQTQQAVFHCESPPGVIQARRTALAGLELPASLTLSPLGAEVSQHLLLGDHRPLPQPIMLAPPTGKAIVTHPLTGFVKPLNRLIPHPPAAVPLSQQSRQRSCTGAQTVPIAHDGHTANASAAVRQQRPFLQRVKVRASSAVHP